MRQLRIVFFVLTLFTMKTEQIFANSFVDWVVVDANTKKEIPLGSKGSVQEAFLQNGLLPDPFYGDNEKLYLWMEDHNWTFKGTFLVRYDDIKQEFLNLEFPSVDTYATIKLNGKVIGTTNNAFVKWTYDVKNLVHIGTNTLEVEFISPVLFHKDEYKNEKYHLPAPNDTHVIAIAPKVRKPQYHFGWDWALRMNLMGFHKPVEFVAFSRPKTIYQNVQTLDVVAQTGSIQFDWQLTQIPKGAVWTSKNFPLKEIKNFDNHLQAKITIEQAKLWWPNGYGEAYLYSDTWTLKDEKGRVLLKQDVKFGVRKTALVQEKDQWGTSYTIVINDQPIFCKGANVIPQEVFISRVDNEKIEEVIQAAKFANMNMLRVWGGGYYPDDYFYQRCDELGIMVWQDFMFACAMYPGDIKFLENVETEMDQQIPRISRHPSVVIFNGNNEVDVAWKNWGFQLKYLLGQKAQREIEKSYDYLFKNLIAKKVAHYSSIPYIHTSPLSNWGKEEFYNSGSQHYWGVWHGKDPIEDMGNKSGRFNAEYGFQSFPTYSTLKSFAEEQDWSLSSSVMSHHQKSYVGNGMIQKHSDQLFGKAKNFEDFVYYSQLTQARAVELAISSHRASFPRCAGTIYWQLNDCWPAPTWSSVDYLGNYKALHYRARDLYKSTAIVAVEKELGKKQFYVVSEKEKPEEVQVEYFDLEGKFIEMHVLPASLNEFGIKKLPLDILQQTKLTDYIVRFIIDQKKESEQFFYNETANPREAKNFTKFEVTNQKDGRKSVVFQVDKAMLDVWITSKEKNIFFEKNFTILLPGKYSFVIEGNNKIEREDLLIKYR